MRCRGTPHVTSPAADHWLGVSRLTDGGRSENGGESDAGPSGHARCSAVAKTSARCPGQPPIGALRLYGHEKRSTVAFGGAVPNGRCRTLAGSGGGTRAAAPANPLGIGASEHYTGNVGAGTGFEVKPESKLDTEIDISHSQRPLWDGVEFALVQALLGALDGYAASNPGLATPFSWTDEGFRLKRYSATSDSDGGGGRRRANSGEAAVGGEALGADLPHHHAWHADAGSAGELGCRGIAAIFYFNDVTSGGETVFMSPRPAAVAPRKGRLLLFPASFAYYHAGAEPRSHHKYIATTFASACDLPKSGHFQPLPLLPVARRHVLRAASTAGHSNASPAHAAICSAVTLRRPGGAMPNVARSTWRRAE